MQVIWHQHVGMDSNLELACSIGQPRQKNSMIIIVAKNHSPIVTTLNDVMRLVGDDEAGKSSHDKKRKVIGGLILREFEQINSTLTLIKDELDTD